jgi:acetolactate synthase small subunit
MIQTVSILLRNQEDALLRLLGVFYRRGYLIESLSMAPDCEDHVSIIAKISCSQLEVGRLMRYVANLVDVVTTEVLSSDAADAPMTGTRIA